MEAEPGVFLLPGICLENRGRDATPRVSTVINIVFLGETRRVASLTPLVKFVVVPFGGVV